MTDCVIDQGGGGNGLEVGYENFNNTDTGAAINDPATGTPIAFVRNLTFRRVDIVRKRNASGSYRRAGLGIHLVDDVPLSNVLYEDVNVEHVEGEYWAWFGAFYTSDYSYGTGRAPISGVTLRRVTFDGPSQLPIHLQGGGGSVVISGLLFDNVYVRGSRLTSTAPINGVVTWEVSAASPSFA